MEIYTKAPIDFRIENVNVSSSEYSKTEKHILIKLPLENDKNESVRMSVSQFNNLRQNVVNLSKQIDHLKKKLHQG